MHVLQRIAERLKFGVDRKAGSEVRSAVKTVCKGGQHNFCWMDKGRDDKSPPVRTKDIPVFCWMKEEDAEKAEDTPPAWTPPVVDASGWTPFQRRVLAELSRRRHERHI